MDNNDLVELVCTPETFRPVGHEEVRRLDQEEGALQLTSERRQLWLGERDMGADLREIEVEYRCGHQATIQARVATVRDVAQVKEVIKTRLCADCSAKWAMSGDRGAPRGADGISSAARWGQRDRGR